MDVRARATGKPSTRLGIPQPLQSLARHEGNLCLMLELFEDSLKRFEANRQDFGAYFEATAFLDVIYLISRMLLDAAAGVVRHYYKCNERCDLPESINDMLKKSS